MTLPSAVPQNIINSLVALASTAPEGNFIDSIAYLKPKMVKGGIIWFDDAIGSKDYIGTPGQVNGADFAMRELYGINYEISDCGKPYVIV